MATRRPSLATILVAGLALVACDASIQRTASPAVSPVPPSDVEASAAGGVIPPDGHLHRLHDGRWSAFEGTGFPAKVTIDVPDDWVGRLSPPWHGYVAAAVDGTERPAGPRFVFGSPTAVYSDTCASLIAATAPIGRSIEDSAALVEGLMSESLDVGPSQPSAVGGFPAQQLRLVPVVDGACSEHRVFQLGEGEPYRLAAGWDAYLWLVDVDGRHAMVALETPLGTPHDEFTELWEILESIELEPLDADGIVREASDPEPADRTGDFVETGALAQARSEHTATLLPDGRVLVIGGWADGAGDEPGGDPNCEGTCRALKSAEIWEPETGTFRAAGEMAIARSRHEAVLLPDGRVFVVGGEWEADDESFVEVWDPETETFEPAGALGWPRSSPAAALLRDGRILVVAGETWRCPNSAEGCSEEDAQPAVSSAELWDPATGTFSPAGDLPRRRLVPWVLELTDGRIIIGSYSSWVDSTNAVEEWNADRHTFREIDLGLGDACCPGFRPLANGLLLVTREGDQRLLDLASGVSQSVSAAGSRAWLMELAPLDDSRLLAVRADEPRGFAEVWDLDTGSVAPAGLMPDNRGGFSLTILPDGGALLIGGALSRSLDGLSTPVSTALIWDPR